MNRSSQVFFTVFFLAIAMSLAVTYYVTVVQKSYVVFTDPETVPEPIDFIANIFGIEIGTEDTEE